MSARRVGVPRQRPWGRSVKLLKGGCDSSFPWKGKTMIQKPKAEGSAERHVKEIKRQTRRKFSVKEKIRIVLEGLRGEYSIAELCRRGSGHLSTSWSKRCDADPDQVPQSESNKTTSGRELFSPLCPL